MTIKTINIPDIGGAEDVDVVEVCVSVGDEVAEGDSLLVLETDKASMDVPAPEGGKISALIMKEGDTCKEGDAILELEIAGSEANAKAPAAEPAKAAEPETEKTPAPAVSTARSETVKVPDIGDFTDVDLVEVCVSVGDVVAEGDSLLVLETDKASMEVPSPMAGVVESIMVSEGGTVTEGDDILVLSVSDGSAPASAPAAEPAVAEAPAAEEKPAAAPAPAAASSETVTVPDIGGHSDVDVVEVCVSVGDEVAEGDSLIVLETDKASMEVPAPSAGVVESMVVSEGGTVSEGDPILVLKVAGSVAPTPAAEPSKAPAPTPAAAPPSKPQPAAKPAAPAASATVDLQALEATNKNVHAGPAVRALAREFGVDLGLVSGTGPKNRILKEDVQNYVKQALSAPKPASAAGVVAGNGIPPVPEVDFSQFGEIELEKMSKIKRITAENMSRCWLNVPHVTHYDDADISALEQFRKDLKAEAEKEGVRLTPLPFIMKAVTHALKMHPNFNTSMHADGEHIVHKKYIHIGMAVDTPAGLVVPVIRDADKKTVYQLATEISELGAKAQAGKLRPDEMQGASFSITSLGNIGGTKFTPIVPVPVVGILGLARAEMKPKWNGSEFEPRKILPLCLSYDHRAINGADAGRFMNTLVSLISDIRRILL